MFLKQAAAGKKIEQMGEKSRQENKEEGMKV